MTSRYALLALALALAGCAEDPGAGKTAATINTPPAEQPAATPAPAPAADGLAVDVSSSRIEALGAKVTKQHSIAWSQWSGTVQLDGDQLSGLQVEVDVASLSTDSPKLEKHLRSPDFFDVGAHPKATFVSTEIAPGGADGATHTVTGDLTLRGTTKNISFPATVAVSDGAVKASAEFVIDRQDFGIVYPGKPDDVIQDNVALTIELVAPTG